MSIATYGQESNPVVQNTTRQTMLESQKVNNNGHIPRDLLGYRSNTHSARSADMRTIQHKPAPSPLQTTAMMADSHTDGNPSISRSPTTSRAGSASQYSSQSSPSPHTPSPNSVADQDQPNAYRDRLGEGFATRGVATDDAVGQSGDNGISRGHVAASTKTQPYGQLRNVSSPFPQSQSTTDSHPRSSSSSSSTTTTATGATTTRTTSSPFANTTIRQTSRSMPRTSSIDSAISTISTATSHSHKSSQDSFVSSPADISYLINTAGSPEAVIQHLLKEKQHSTAQNGQLWRLVDKQRVLLLGLNQDLERALKDKERYRKKLKEHLAQVPPVPSAAPLPDPREASQSPTPGDLRDELPIQGNTRQDTGPDDSHGPSVVSKSSDTGQNPILNGTIGDVPAKMGQTNMRTENRPSRADSTSLNKNAQGSDNVASISEPRRALPSLDTKVGVPNPNAQGSNTVVSPASFTAKRSRQKSAAGSSPALIASSPPGSSNETFMAQPRKLPPAPLDLRPPGREEVNRKPEYGPEDHSGSEYEDSLEVDEIIPAFDRGRKKTRAEDDREREAAALKEKQDRSRSKKEKGSKTPSETIKAKASDVDVPAPPPVAPMSSAIKAVSPPANPGGESNYLTAPPSLASVLTPPSAQPTTTVKRTLLSAQPLSPGLPMSPRPVDRPMNSPMPRMPRDGAGPSIASPPLSPPTGFIGLPLSPRAPKQPFSVLPQTPMSISTPTPRFPEHPKETSEVPLISSMNLPQPADAPVSDSQSNLGPSASRMPDSIKPKGVYRAFVSEAYPDLLIPPNALPSIIVKIISSRLKPSRNSYLANKTLEEEPVFTLGVSARSDLQELWHVEKSLLSLPQLDQQLKQSTGYGAKLPDRALFSGHAPAKVDARKKALERYFEAILDTPMDDNAALALCYYLSTHVVEPVNDDVSDNVSASGSPVTFGPDGKLVKEGYLTKKGKNFGGWKARFFVLDEPVLRYYESQGGSLLGTIKLPNSKIGKPLPHRPSDSPSRAEDHDSQYRHAFLILEPKRKDSSSHVRHTLCAESDVERDAWVEALLCYVEGYPGDEQAKKPSLSSTDSGSSKATAPQKRPRRNEGSLTDSPQSDTFDGLQTVSYDETVAAHPPSVNMIPDKRFAESPSPTNLGGQHSAGTQKSLVSKTISGPSNGAKIQDVGAWGNKPLAPPHAIDKEHKKRSIWGFHNKHPLDTTVHSNDSSLSLTQQQYYERISNVRPAFGLQLADAVEYCSPRGVDVCLPAVVYRCLEYLKAHNAWSEEGIFRLSGSSVVIKGLRDRFNNEGDFDFLADNNFYDVHAVASLLKLYLRELPSSVLTRELHLDFLNVLDLDEKSKKIAAFKLLVQKLPQANWTLIRALSEFLIGIVNNSNVNKMSVRNVCIVFSPTLNIHAPVFSTFLTDFNSIFAVEYELASPPAFEISVTEPLTPEDIRSPRRQMFSDIPTPSYNQENFPKTSNPGPSYEQARQGSRVEHDIGFIPLQPSYEPPTSNPPPNSQQQGSIMMPGSEYGVISRKPGVNSAAKARRRESSMLLMGGGGDGGMQQKSSVAAQRDDSVMVHEESAFH